jgi:P27 family predicted phage terminase small subunit
MLKLELTDLGKLGADLKLLGFNEQELIRALGGSAGLVPEDAMPELTVELSKLNLITKLDRGALATYCGAYGMWAEAMEQIQKYGTMVKSPTGFPIQSPYLSIANRQAEIMMRIASEFGFTPASRSRISAPPSDQLPLFDGAPGEVG